MKIEKITSEIKLLLDSFSESVISFEWAPPTYPHSSVAINFNTSKLLGNICIWENGSIDVLVYEIKSGSEIFNRSFTYQNTKNLSKILKELIRNIINTMKQS